MLNILIVEDNPGDVDLARECLEEGRVPVEVHVAPDGAEALSFLRRQTGWETAPRPDLVLLDLNLPKLDGRQVLEDMKHDERLCTIPVVVLTSSSAQEDVLRSYRLHANCYIQKPVDLEQFMKIVQTINDFWFSVVRLPPEPN